MGGGAAQYVLLSCSPKKLLVVELMKRNTLSLLVLFHLVLNVSAICGVNITANTTLTDDLICDGTGIRIGAANVTLDCNGHTIRYNLSNQQLFGVYIELYDNIVVKNCVISEYEYGIFSFDEYEIGQHSDNDTLINNTIFNTKWGIVLSGSDNNLINNTIINNTGGISLSGSADILINNNLTNASILVEGDVSNANSHIIDTTNIVNGRPIFYLKNIIDSTVPNGAGQIVLANGTNITIQNQTISNVLYGIRIISCRGCLLQNKAHR